MSQLNDTNAGAADKMGRYLMDMSGMLKKLSLACFLAAPALASAGGLLLYEVGTADVGLASAGYSARAQDAATVYTNVAGMTRLKGTQVMLGTQMLYGDAQFAPDSGTSPALGGKDGGNPVGWLPGGGLFVTHSLTPDLVVGFAATGNFGLALKYDRDWVGRYRTQDATLMAVSLLPSIAYRATEKLSLGASLNASYGILENRLALNRIGTGADGQLTLDDRAWGFGLNLGVLYELTPATRLGMTYTSETKLDFKSKAKFSGTGPVLQALLQARGLQDSTLGLAVNVPQTVDVSIFHQLDERWALLGSLGWQNWSRFGKVDVTLDDTSNPSLIKVDLETKDTWRLALGAQYRISAPWLLNFGMAYDSKFQKSSQISPSLPTNDAWRFGLGIQNQAARDFEWGVAAEYLYGGSTKVSSAATLPLALGGRGDLSGEYNPRIYFLSANFVWKY